MRCPLIALVFSLVLTTATTSLPAPLNIPTPVQVKDNPDLQTLLLGRVVVKQGKQPPATLPPGSYILEEELPAGYRVIGFGDGGTDDYVPSRLNLYLSANSAVESVLFG